MRLCIPLSSMTLFGLLVAGSAEAQVFTDEAAFLAASGPLGFESFECYPAGAIASADAIETPAFAMTIVPVLASSAAPMNVQAAPNPSGPHATHGTRFVQAGATPSTNGQFDLTFHFVAPVEEFALVVTDFGEYPQLPGALTATILGTTYTIASNPPAQTDGGERFWGLRSVAAPFTSVVLRKSTQGDGIGLDEIRFSDLGLPDHCDSVWTDLGGGVGGPNGLPQLSGVGCLVPGETTSIVLAQGIVAGTSWMVIGASELGAPFKGGVLWPNPDVLLAGLPLDGAGALTIGFPWPAGLPSGVSITWQHWMPYGTVAVQWAASNGLRSTTP